jgi:hypothetical protein
MFETLRSAGVRGLTVLALVAMGAPSSQAGLIKVGSLVFQNTIPAGPEVPGTNAFWLYWSSSLLPLTNVTLTVTGTDAQGQTFTPKVWTQSTFDPGTPLGSGLGTDLTVKEATLTGRVLAGYTDWMGQRYTISEQEISALLSNASGLVPFPLGPDGTGDTVDVNVNPTPRSYYLAEGARVWTFDTLVAIANRGKADAPVRVDFLKELSSSCKAAQDGGPVERVEFTVPLESRWTVEASGIPGLSGCSFSIVVTSTDGVPLAVERTMTWDGGHGSHTGTAADGLSPVWYFAEGVQSTLDTYLCMANPHDTETTVDLTFFLPPRWNPNTNQFEPVLPVKGTLTLLPNRRGTVWTGSVPGLNWKSFGIMLVASQPVVAERAVYFGSASRWDGGTLAMGVTAPSLNWYFGEGALNGSFDQYLLLSNPSSQPASVTVDYLPATGPVVQLPYTVAGESRLTVYVTGEPLGLQRPNGLGMRVNSDVPVLAERAMYLWPGSWHDGHASPGATELGTVWEVADCVVGNVALAPTVSAVNAETFILVSNPGASDSQVDVTYSREGGRAPVTKSHTIPAGSRKTIWVNGDAPELVDERFGAGIVVQAGSPPVVVERSVYWDSQGKRWASANNTLGTKLQ